jgi:hypothetical protein
MMAPQRQRESRRILGIGLAVSALAHAAALAWLGLPIRVPAERASIAVVAATAEPLLVLLPQVEITPALAAAAAAAGGSGTGVDGGAPARPSPDLGAPAERATPAARPVTAESIVLAGVDSARMAEPLPLPAVASTPVVALAQPVGAPPEATSTQPAARPAHTPGSVGSAKDRWAGAAPGSAGAGSNDGRGGITIGTKRGGVKRHPPLGVPSRGRGGPLW